MGTSVASLSDIQDEQKVASLDDIDHGQSPTELANQALSGTGITVSAPPKPKVRGLNAPAYGPSPEYLHARAVSPSDAAFKRETAAEQEALTSPAGVATGVAEAVLPGSGHLVRGAARATQPGEHVSGALESLGGATDIMAPLVGPAMFENPVNLAKGMGVGMAAGYGAKKGAAKLGATPEEQDLAEGVGFFLPSIAGAVIQPRAAIVHTPEATGGAGEAFGGRVAAGAAVTPESVNISGRVGSRVGTVRIPRNGTQGPALDETPPMEGQEANPKAAEAARAAGVASRAEQMSQRMARGMPPQEPEPAKAPEGPQQVTRKHIDIVAQQIEKLPENQRQQATLDVHDRLTKWLVEHPRTTDPFTGEVVMVKDEADAAKIAQGWINAGVKELNEKAKAEAKSRESASARRTDTAPSRGQKAPSAPARAQATPQTGHSAEQPASVAQPAGQPSRQAAQSGLGNGNGSPAQATTAGTPEAAERDTALFQQAKAELGPQAQTSDVLRRAQELKQQPEIIPPGDAKSVPAVPQPETLPTLQQVSDVGTKDPESKRTVMQPTESAAENQKLATAAAPELADHLAQISASIPGAKFDRIRPVKSQERVGEKVDDGQPAETVSDYVGAQITADTSQAKDQLIAALKQHFPVVEVEDKFLEGRPDKAGYPSANVQVQLPTGATAEVQIVPTEVQQIADKTHELYEKGRDAEQRGDNQARDEFWQQAAELNRQAMEQFKARQNGKRPGSRALQSLGLKEPEPELEAARRGASGVAPISEIANAVPPEQRASTQIVKDAQEQAAGRVESRVAEKKEAEKPVAHVSEIAPPSFSKGDKVTLSDGREGTVSYVHPQMGVVRVKTADGKTVQARPKDLKAPGFQPTSLAPPTGISGTRNAASVRRYNASVEKDVAAAKAHVERIQRAESQAAVDKVKQDKADRAERQASKTVEQLTSDIAKLEAAVRQSYEPDVRQAYRTSIRKVEEQRAAKDFEALKDDKAMEQAFADWVSGRAYWQRNHYRIMGVSKGWTGVDRKALWSDAVKQYFGGESTSRFHMAAHQAFADSGKAQQYISEHEPAADGYSVVTERGKWYIAHNGRTDSTVAYFTKDAAERALRDDLDEESAGPEPVATINGRAFETSSEPITPKQEVAPGTETPSKLSELKRQLDELLDSKMPTEPKPRQEWVSKQRRLESAISDAESEARYSGVPETKPPDGVALPDATKDLRAHQKAYFQESLKPVMAAWDKLIGTDGVLHDQLIKGTQKPKDKPAEFQNDYIHIEVPQDGKFLIVNTPYAINRALKGSVQAFAAVKPQTFPNRNANSRAPKEFDNERYIAGLKEEIAQLEKDVHNGARADYAREQLKAARENLAEATKNNAAADTGQHIAILKTLGASSEEVGQHLSDLHRRAKQQAGSAILGATNPIGFIYEAATRLNSAYDQFVDKALQRMHLGRAFPELERTDPDFAAKVRLLQHAPAYWRAKAEAIDKDIAGALTREQEKGFMLMADKASRDWLNENKHDEWQKYQDDPVIQEALEKYKPYEDELREAQRALGGAVIEDDYIRRVYEKHVAGVGEGKKNAEQYPRFDRVITPQMANNKGRVASPEHYYLYGLHEFGPSFVSRYIATHLKLAEHTLAADFLSKATKLETGDEQPSFIDYSGQRYYSPEAARLIRESQADSKEGKAIAEQLNAERAPDTEPIEQLPKPGEIREYGVYNPNQGSRMEAKARGLAHAVAAGAETSDVKGQAYGLMAAMNQRYLGPKDLVAALDSGAPTAVPSFVRDLGGVMSPIVGAVRQNILTSGIPHIKNILRRTMLATHPTGQLSPLAWHDAVKVAFDTELTLRGLKSAGLKEEALKGVNSPIMDALLKHGGMSPQGGIEYKHYLNLNFEQGAWREFFNLFPALKEAYSGEGGTLKRAAEGTGKVAGEILSAPAHVANAAMRKAVGKDWHEILFGPGGIDQRARVNFYQNAKRLNPDITDQEIADAVNQWFGNYARTGWTDLQKAASPFMMFPGWDYSSVETRLRYPIRTKLPAVIITLLLGYITARHLSKRKQRDVKRVHAGGRTWSDTLLNERMPFPFVDAPLDYAAARLQGRGRGEALSAVAEGLSGDAGVLLGMANPLVTMPAEIASNKRYMGGSQEIYKRGDFSHRGKVVPRAAGGKGLEDWGIYLGDKLVPQVGSSSSSTDFASWLGRNVGTSNYPDKKHKR